MDLFENHFGELLMLPTYFGWKRDQWCWGAFIRLASHRIQPL